MNLRKEITISYRALEFSVFFSPSGCLLHSRAENFSAQRKSGAENFHPRAANIHEVRKISKIPTRVVWNEFSWLVVSETGFRGQIQSRNVRNKQTRRDDWNCFDFNLRIYQINFIIFQALLLCSWPFFNFYSLIYQIIFIFFQALLLAVLEKLLGSDSKSCSCLRRCWVTWNGNVNITWNVACAWQVYVTGWDLLRLALNLLLLELEKLLELQVMLRLKLLHLLRDPVWWCWYLLRRLIPNFLILEAVNSHRCGGEHFRMIRLRNVTFHYLFRLVSSHVLNLRSCEPTISHQMSPRCERKKESVVVFVFVNVINSFFNLLLLNEWPHQWHVSQAGERIHPMSWAPRNVMNRKLIETFFKILI